MRFQYGKCKHCEVQMVVDADKKKVICPNCGEICYSKESVELYASRPAEQDSGRINRRMIILIAIAVGGILLIFGLGCLIVALSK